MEEELRRSIQELQNLGLEFWAKKLQECLEQTSKSEKVMAKATLKLFGGFGTLNDIAFSDSDAPKGMSGEQATKQYFSVINNLHRVAKQHAI